MLPYTLDVTSASQWLRTTPGAAALAQPYYCTEAGLFYGRAHFATAHADKEGYLLLYTLRGEGLVEQNGAQATLGPGTVLLLNCRAVQGCRTAPGSDCWHHYWAHVDGPGVAAMEGLLHPDGRLHPVALPALDAGRAFEEILAGIGTETALNAVKASFAIHRLLAEMAGRLLTARQANANRQMIEAAVEQIRSHYAEPLRLDVLLRAAHISKSYFLRLFRQYMGTTPYNFLLCYRITQAKELLVVTDLPIGQVARRVGFGDESNFSTRFTAMVGQSPLRYRKSAMTPR